MAACWGSCSSREGGCWHQGAGQTLTSWAEAHLYGPNPVAGVRTCGQACLAHQAAASHREACHQAGAYHQAEVSLPEGACQAGVHRVEAGHQGVALRLGTFQVVHWGQEVHGVQDLVEDLLEILVAVLSVGVVLACPVVVPVRVACSCRVEAQSWVVVPCPDAAVPGQEEACLAAVLGS